MTAFLDVLRVITTVTAILVGIAPLPDFWRVHKNRDTGEVSILPVVLLFCNCYVWVFYSFLVGNIFPLFAVTLFGVATSVIFSAIYYRWSKERAYIHKLFAITFVVLAVFTTYRFLGTSGVTNQSEEGVEKTLGFIGVTVNIILYASPLETMKKVVQTKNAASLPIWISAVFLVNAGLWVLLAILIDDMFVMVPNALGVLFCSIQVILYIMYRPKKAEELQYEIDSVGTVKDDLPVTDTPPKYEEIVLHISKSGEYNALSSPVVVRAA